MQSAPPGKLVSRGTGSMTALIHGAFSASSFWHKPLPRRVLAGRTVSYPLPGHYPWLIDRSNLNRLLTTRTIADAYAMALRRDFLGSPVHLIGHSTGAFVAVAIATRHPHLVSRLTIAGGFSDGRLAGGSPFLRGLLKAGGYSTFALRNIINLWLATATTFNAGLATVMANGTAPWSNPLFSRHAELARLDLLRSDLDTIFGLANWISEERLRPVMSRCRQPTLVLAGKDDPVVPFEHQREMAGAFSNGRLVVMDRTGHLPMSERPNAFCAHIDNCLQAL